MSAGSTFPQSTPAESTRLKMTAPKIRTLKGIRKIKMVTAYDHPSARVADRAGADIILVGDSVANVVLGHTDTLSVSVDDMVGHTAAVATAKPKALVVGDMPWLSYHSSREETVHNAGRFIRDGKAEAVKLEGGRKRIDMIEAVRDAEIPVMGHLGLTPQSVHAMGGYRVQGKQAGVAYDLISDAKALEEAGVFAIVLEAIPDILANMITEEVAIPTIGIGAGPGCDGQVLVYHDLLGYGEGHMAKFVRQYANLSDVAVRAMEAWFADIDSGAFPSEDETYHMPAESAEMLAALGHSGSSNLMADEAMEH